MTLPRNFSLALGGGGARGLAHIGVIRYLEEEGLFPQAISGTSMGAIIATLLALGKTSHDMEAVLKEIKWLSLMDFDMKKGLVKGVKIESLLEKIFEGKTFDDVRVPLFITSTDIDTGERFVFTSGKLSQAVRASIGIPGIFAPYEYQKRNLVDGGLTANLPIELLPSGPVIAVSAMRDLTRKIAYHRTIFSFDWQKTIFSNSYSILQKTIDIMLAQNEARSVISRNGVIYIRPAFDNLDYYDFQKFPLFIQSGQRAMSSYNKNHLSEGGIYMLVRDTFWKIFKK